MLPAGNASRWIIRVRERGPPRSMGDLVPLWRCVGARERMKRPRLFTTSDVDDWRGTCFYAKPVTTPFCPFRTRISATAGVSKKTGELGHSLSLGRIPNSRAGGHGTACDTAVGGWRNFTIALTTTGRMAARCALIGRRRGHRGHIEDVTIEHLGKQEEARTVHVQRRAFFYFLPGNFRHRQTLVPLAGRVIAAVRTKQDAAQ